MPNVERKSRRESAASEGKSGVMTAKCRASGTNDCGGEPGTGPPPRVVLEVLRYCVTEGQVPSPSFMLVLFRISVRESGSFVARAAPR